MRNELTQIDDSNQAKKACCSIVSCAFLWILMIILASFGCSNPKSAGHTHLWTTNKEKNVWSYERVESLERVDEVTEIADFLKQELQRGDIVRFINGSKIEFDGEELRVNDHLISASNVQIEGNGTIRENAFIKTD